MGPAQGSMARRVGDGAESQPLRSAQSDEWQRQSAVPEAAPIPRASHPDTDPLFRRVGMDLDT